MSLRMISSLNSPPLVAFAGLTTMAGLPALDAALSTSASMTILKAFNVTAFATNVVAVSMPGRLDGRQDEEMRKGKLSPDKPNTPPTQQDQEKTLGEDPAASAYSLNRSRTLICPSGWAFAIWGPIYLGEAVFVAAQLFASDAASSALGSVLPQITAPFVTANLAQSLWCASFRPSYGQGWKKYVSVAMLAATSYSLSLVHAAGCAAPTAADAMPPSYLLLPMTVHFAWTSAATLVNLNGSLATDDSASPTSIVALGHSSALAAAALGITVTVLRESPAYGLTLAWALAACADGISKRVPSQSPVEEPLLAKAARVQKNLCWAASFLCATVATYVGVF